MTDDSTERFTSRVENYVRYRPGYPAEVLTYLAQEWGLDPDAVIADVGSGTGILARLFLEHGNQVYGVEPNDAMRAAAEHVLEGYSGFRSVDGRAEATGLPDNSVDVIAAGQSFHWFDRAAAKQEFQRILKPDGWVALIWNEGGNGPFMDAYREIQAEFGIDYQQVRHTRVSTDEVLRPFFEPGGFTLREFDNEQVLDFEGLKGRLLSSSYIPVAGHPSFEPMLTRLKTIFERYAVDGRIRMNYVTRLYTGRWRKD